MEKSIGEECRRKEQYTEMFDIKKEKRNKSFTEGAKEARTQKVVWRVANRDKEREREKKKRWKRVRQNIQMVK